ncbi:MAG TPA: hypothetical protein VFW71_15925 [Actinomycetota bacterium]|nr:hypothetical protein [Actinomycetota bacterium]
MGVPDPISRRLRSATITEYAYLTPGGDPLCWPVTPFWDPGRGVLGISVGLAYPNKAHYARLHPRVSALFCAPATEPLVLHGDAVVLDGDLQANTDRYIREMRARFVSARMALNPVCLPMLDFYLPRLWVEIAPTEIARGADHETVADPGTRPDHPPLSAAHRAALHRWALASPTATLAMPGAAGYPVMARVAVRLRADGDLELGRAPGVGPAALTFHSEGLGGVRLDALMARGWVGPDGRFTARRVVGFFGRDPASRPPFFSIFPLSQLPWAGVLRDSLTRELSTRGEPLPRLRVPR